GDEGADPLFHQHRPPKQITRAVEVGRRRFHFLRCRLRTGTWVLAAESSVCARTRTGRRPTVSCGTDPSIPPAPSTVGFSTGGPAGSESPASTGAVTTTSRDGFSSPPSAVHTSANERSSGGGSATLTGTGKPSAASDPVRTSVGSAS